MIDFENHKCCECDRRASAQVTKWEFQREPVTTYYCWVHDPNGAYQRDQQFVYRLAWRLDAHNHYWPPMSDAETKRRQAIVREVAEKMGVRSPTFL